nr:hypothetical protein [Providencia rettgeri]
MGFSGLQMLVGIVIIFFIIKLLVSKRFSLIRKIILLFTVKWGGLVEREQISNKVNTFFDSIFVNCYGVISLRKENNSSFSYEIEINDIETIKKIALNSNSVESLYCKKNKGDDFDTQYLFSRINKNEYLVQFIDFKGDFDFAELHLLSGVDKLNNPLEDIIYYYFDLLSARDYEKYGSDIFLM